ncbi:hypothetical protein ACTFJG_25860, partial [Klebsiella electrica]
MPTIDAGCSPGKGLPRRPGTSPVALRLPELLDMGNLIPCRQLMPDVTRARGYPAAREPFPGGAALTGLLDTGQLDTGPTIDAGCSPGKGLSRRPGTSPVALRLPGLL